VTRQGRSGRDLRAITLGRDNDVGTFGADVLQRLTGELFRIALRIDVRRIEKIDARLEGTCDDRGCALLVDFADHLEHTLATERHGAETDFRHE
jgi:hypothetical protein